MAITAPTGYMVNPDNPNGVVKLTDINPNTGFAYGVPTATQQGGINTPIIPPPAIAPSNAGNVKTSSQVQIPTGTPPNGNITDANASTAGVGTQIDTMQKYFADQATLAKQQADSLQADQEKNKGLLSSLLSNTKTSSQTRADAYSNIGIDPATYFADQKTKITEIGSLTKDYNDFKSQVDEQKAQLIGQGRGIPQDLLDNQAAQIDRNAAPKLNAMSANINAQSAVLQALQGNFNSATNFVNQAVTDATADAKFKVDTFNTFYQMNQDTINSLDSKYQSAITNAMTLAKDSYDQQVSDKKAVGDLMINNPQAGITMTDTLASAQSKAAQYISSNPSLDDQYKKAQIAKIYADINTANSAVDQNAVDGWVTNINSGKAKLTDIKDANLRNAVSLGLSKSGGTELDSLQETKDSLTQLQNMVNNDTLTNPSGFKSAVGVKGVSSLFGIFGSPVAGSAAANFDAKLQQVIGSVVLPNLDKLKGLGRVTQKEFDTLKASVTSLSPKLSESQFRTELQNVIDTIDKKLSQVSQSTISVTAPNGQVYSFPDQASADKFKKDAGIK